MLKLEFKNFDLDKIADSGQCFRWKKTGDRAYEIPAYGKVLHISQPEDGAAVTDCSPEEFEAVWWNYFDLESDYGAITDRMRTEITPRYLYEAEKAARGIRILRQELWEAALSFIISQNNNIPRIKQSIERICAQYGGFPTASEICSQPERLAECGLGYRDRYIAGTAEYFAKPGAEQHLKEMDYAGAKAELMKLNGVGAKVADCICLYGLGHKEAFPKDVWIKRIEEEHFGGHFPVEQYKECAGVLQQYIYFYERSRKNGRN